MVNELNEKEIRLREMVVTFCDEMLNSEYKELCIKMIIKMSQEKKPPYASGKIEIWAAAIIYALELIFFAKIFSYSRFSAILSPK